MRLRRKVVNLINDLVVNDDSIFDENPNHVRQHYCGDRDFLNQLRSNLLSSDLKNMQELQYQDTILRILFRLHQYKPEVLGPELVPALYQHRAAISALIAEPEIDQDLKESLTEAVQSVDDCIAAPSRPFVRNFESETDVEKVHKPNSAAAAQKNIHGLALNQ